MMKISAINTSFQHFPLRQLVSQRSEVSLLKFKSWTQLTLIRLLHKIINKWHWNVRTGSHSTNAQELLYNESWRCREITYCTYIIKYHLRSFDGSRSNLYSIYPKEGSAGFIIYLLDSLSYFLLNNIFIHRSFFLCNLCSYMYKYV